MMLAPNDVYFIGRFMKKMLSLSNRIKVLDHCPGVCMDAKKKQ